MALRLRRRADLPVLQLDDLRQGLRPRRSARAARPGQGLQPCNLRRRCAAPALALAQGMRCELLKFRGDWLPTM